MAAKSTDAQRTCVCGRFFRTLSGARNHYNACPQERARSAAYVARIEATPNG